MPALFKPSRSRPLPPDTEIVTRSGKPHAKILKRGKPVLYPLTEDGQSYIVEEPKWAADVVLASGDRKRVRFSPSRQAAEVMLGKLLKRIEDEKSGVVDRFADHRKRSLAELLAEYQRHIVDKGATAKEAKQSVRRCELAFDGCGFVLLSDLDATPAERWLADRRALPKAKGGFGPATSNHYRKSLVAFGNWLVKTRRTSESPFRHIPKVNAEVDVRHERRPLSPDEFDRMLAAARTGTVYRRQSGPDRAALYLVAGMTGLRASELASLTRESFDLDAETPVVTVEAAYSKHRRRDEVPLHPDLVAELRPWLAAKEQGKPLWPGKWAKHTEAVDMIRRDLEVARTAWIDEANTPDEKQRRGESDFLSYCDQDGRFADFHSLRHRFVTELVRAGVAPKDAKELARHSTITLTMDRYSHVSVRDTAAAVGKLTMPTTNKPTTESVSLRATGTEGGTNPESPRAASSAADFGNGLLRLRTGEDVSPLGVDSYHAPNALNYSGLESVEENRAEVREVCPTGVEPVTFGSGGGNTTVEP